MVTLLKVIKDIKRKNKHKKVLTSRIVFTIINRSQKQFDLIFRGVAQFGSFEVDRCLWQIKEDRNGAAVEIFPRSKW